MVMLDVTGSKQQPTPTRALNLTRLDVGRAVCRQLLVHNVARNALPAVRSWRESSRKSSSNDGLVLSAHLVLRVVVCGRGEPPVVSVCTVIASKLRAYLRLVLEHLVVSAVGGEAARVVLVEDLDLESTRFQSGEEVPEQECRVKTAKTVNAGIRSE